MSESALKEKKTNLKGRYFEKDLGDGTFMSIIRVKRPDDDTWALALRLRANNKTATCFLEDINGVCFVSDLTDALLDYLEDVSDIAIEKSEADGKAFILRKEQEAKDKETVTD